MIFINSLRIAREVSDPLYALCYSPQLFPVPSPTSLASHFLSSILFNNPSDRICVAQILLYVGLPPSIRGYTLKESWSPLQKPSAVYSSSVRDGAHGPCPSMLEYWLTTGLVQRATVAMISWVQRSYHVEDIVSLWSPLALPTSASFIFLLPLLGWSLGLAVGLRAPSRCSICGWVLHGIPPHFGQLENLG